MPHFFGIAPGEQRKAPGIRVSVTADGESAWFHGKWLDLGPDHGVIWIEGAATFTLRDGRRKRLGQFPAWVVHGSGKGAPHAAMFDIGQFRGGSIEDRQRGLVRRYEVTR